MEEETKTEQVQATESETDSKPAEHTELTYTQKQVDEMINEKLSEADKLRKMNAQQKAAYERELFEKKLSEREKAVSERELRATAKETLTSKGFPLELADCLDYSDADKCSKSIEAVSKAFNNAVTNAVNAKLKQTPPKAAGDNTTKKDPFLEGLGL